MGVFLIGWNSSLALRLSWARFQFLSQITWNFYTFSMTRLVASFKFVIDSLLLCLILIQLLNAKDRNKTLSLIIQQWYVNYNLGFIELEACWMTYAVTYVYWYAFQKRHSFPPVLNPKQDGYCNLLVPSTASSVSLLI